MGNYSLSLLPGGYLVLPREITSPSVARDGDPRRGQRGCLAQVQMHIQLPVSTQQALERHQEGPSQTLVHLNPKEFGVRRNLLDKMAGVTGAWPGLIYGDLWAVALQGCD